MSNKEKEERYNRIVSNYEKYQQEQLKEKEERYNKIVSNYEKYQQEQQKISSMTKASNLFKSSLLNRQKKLKEEQLNKQQLNKQQTKVNKYSVKPTKINNINNQNLNNSKVGYSNPLEYDITSKAKVYNVDNIAKDLNISTEEAQKIYNKSAEENNKVLTKLSNYIKNSSALNSSGGRALASVIDGVRDIDDIAKTIKDSAVKGAAGFASYASKVDDKLTQTMKKMGLPDEMVYGRYSKTYRDENIGKGIEVLANNREKIVSGEMAYEDLLDKVEKVNIEDSYNTRRSETKKMLSDVKNNADKEIQKNIENTNTKLTRKVTELSSALGNTLVGVGISSVDPIAGTTYFIGSSADSYYDDAINRGMNEDEALLHGTVLGTIEGLTEQIPVGKMLGAGKNIGKESVKETLKKYGISMTENAIQESVIEPISEISAYAIGGKETADFSDMGSRMLKSGIDGALSAVLLNGVNAGINSAVQLQRKITNKEPITTEEVKSCMQDIQESGKVDVEKIVNQELQYQTKKLTQSTQTQENKQSNNVTNVENKNAQNAVSEQIDVVEQNLEKNTNEVTIANNLENNINQNNENLDGKSLKNKAQKYINKSKKQFVDNIVKDLQTSKYSNKEILNESVDKIINEIQNNGKITTEKSNELFEELYSNLLKTDSDYYEQYKDLKTELRNTKFFVSENVRNDIGDYSDFRKRNIGNLVLTQDSNNINIDSKYKELSKRYPELFPEEIINQSEQLQKISEVTNDIKKVETNVQAYLDKNMGPEYKSWAKEDFNNLVNKFSNDVNLALRYNNDNPKKSNLIIAKDELKNIYNQLPLYKKQYEKVLSKEVLTKKDQVQVDRLLKEEISFDELPKDVNKQGILNVYNAKLQLNALQDSIKENKKNIRAIRLEQAEKILGDLSKWKDKSAGWKYSRETTRRNIYDVAPKETAQEIDRNYIQPYHENEAEAIRTINKYTEEIKNLKLSTRKKYSSTFSMQEILDGELKDVVKTRKVSEAELVQIFGEGRITLEQLKETGVDVQKIVDSIKVFRKVYDELFDKVNEVLLNNGLEPVQKRENYFPHFSEAEPDGLLSMAAKIAGIDLSGELLPTDIAGKTQDFKPNKKFVGNFLQRNTDITDFNSLKGFDNYIRGVTDVIYHTEDIMKFRALYDSIRNFYSTEQIKSKIKEIEESTQLTVDEKAEKIKEIKAETMNKSNLANFITWLDNYINIISGKKSINDRASEKELSRKMYKCMNKIESRIGANMVGGNFSVSITNIAPLAQATAEVSPKNLAKGLYGSVVANAKSLIGKRDIGFASESDFITRRRGTNNTNITMFDKITKPLDIISSAFDDVISEGIVRARYIQNLKNGMSQQESLKEADNYVAGLMADRSKGALPTAFNSSNPIAKMVNMFQIEVNNQYSHYFKDIPRDIKNKSNYKKSSIVGNLTYSFAKLLISSYFMNNLISEFRGNATRVLPDPIYIVKELVKGLGNDDEDDDWETIVGTSEEILGNTPFASVPVALFGTTFGFDTDNIGRISISGAIPNINNIGSTLMSDADSEYKKETVKKELEKPIYNLVFPKAGSQVKKTIQGAEAVAEGGSYTTSKDGEKKLQFKVNSKDPKEVFKAYVFGKWSTEGAQNYDSQPLTEKQQQELEELDISMEEYKKYRKDLNELNKIKSDKNSEGNTISGSATGKKAYKVMTNSEYSNKEKSYLIESLNSEDSEYEVTTSTLNKLGESEEVYKYFYGLNAKSKEKFINELEEYNFNCEKLVSFYSNIDEINSKYSKESKLIKEQGYKEDDEKDKISEINQKKKVEIANAVINSNYANEQKLHLYSKSYDNNDVEMAKQLKINADSFIKLNSQQFESDYYANGKAVRNSKQNKIIRYVESLPNLTIAEKAILIKSKSSGYDKYNNQIIKYVDGNSNLTISEKEEILSNLGFKIKNGRVYD